MEDHFTGNQLEGFSNLVQDFRDGNFRTVARKDLPDIYDADPRSLALNLEQGVATVRHVVDTSLIVETGAQS